MEGRAAVWLLVVVAVLAGTVPASASIPSTLRDTERMAETVGADLANHSATIEEQGKLFLAKCLGSAQEAVDRNVSLTNEAFELRGRIAKHKAEEASLPKEIEAIVAEREALNLTLVSIDHRVEASTKLRAVEKEEYSTETKKARQLLQMIRSAMYRVDEAPGLLHRGTPSHKYADGPGGTVAVVDEIESSEESSAASGGSSEESSSASSSASMTSASAEEEEKKIHDVLFVPQTPATSEHGGSLIDDVPATPMTPADMHHLDAMALLEVETRATTSGITDAELHKLRAGLLRLEGVVKGYNDELERGELASAKSHETLLKLLARERVEPAAKFASSVEREGHLHIAKYTAMYHNQKDEKRLAEVTAELEAIDAHLRPALSHCMRKEARYLEQVRRIEESRRTVKAISKVLEEHDNPKPAPPAPGKEDVEPEDDGEIKEHSKSSPCASSPCMVGVCVPQNAAECLARRRAARRAASKGSVPDTDEEGGQASEEDVNACLPYRCDPAPPSRANPCLELDPCPDNTACVADLESERGFACQPNLGDEGAAERNTTRPATCKEHQEEQRRLGVIARSGVYLLRDPKDGAHFPAYCEMAVAGGGWMLAFKQTGFASGSLAHDDNHRGSAALLSSRFDSTSTRSLVGYNQPRQMLFRSAHARNWLVTPSIAAAFQEWDISPSSRYCLYRPLYKRSFHVSSTWDYNAMDLWADANIQLMIDAHPSVSAVTVGQAHKKQHGPQCMMPNCSDRRHGRYEGDCQNSAVGEGNWLIFVR